MRRDSDREYKAAHIFMNCTPEDCEPVLFPFATLSSSGLFTKAKMEV